MPSWELLDTAAAVPRVALSLRSPVIAVEAGVSLGWERFAGRMVSVDRFGASAPGAEVLQRLGMTSRAVTTAVRELAGRRAQASR
jgi:transketolase